MYQDPIERMKEIHIWIGITELEEDKYDRYFDQEKGVCGFCQDIGQEEYDEDFMGAIPLYREPKDILLILSDIALAASEYESVVSACLDKNISKANAVFYYSDKTLSLDADRKFNGLCYIGAFKSDL